MEWVETTAKTVEEAKDAALDRLGVDEQDAEFEILEEPRTGLFGRTRGEARVRARVRPTQPRPKAERRDRRGRGTGGGRSGGNRRTGRGRSSGSSAREQQTPAEREQQDEPAAPSSEATVAVVDDAPRPDGGQRRSRRSRGRGGQRHADVEHDEGSTDMSEAELQEQGELVREFLLELLDAFGVEGEVAVAPAEDGAVELSVTGSDLGLLIGPKGQTLQSIQELSRSVLQRRAAGEAYARVRVDVAGYRERRRAALARFAADIAEQVKESGVQKALEPMGPPDRKVVHDTVNEIEGVTTISEGEEPRRRVVIVPA